jgi:hypothetical protein
MFPLQRIDTEYDLLGNGSVSMFMLQQINTERQNNRGTVIHGDLYSVHLEVSSVQMTVSSDFSFVIRHSITEDTHSPVRNGVSLGQPWIVSCNCREMPLNPIIQSRTCSYQSWNPGHMTSGVRIGWI